MAKGFSIAVSKWLFVIRLLLGEIPERIEFEQHYMQDALLPYLELTQAVRTGDVPAFNTVAQKHSAVFQADHTSNLISRLHHNVLRTGLRRISVAYSRISLKVCTSVFVFKYKSSTSVTVLLFSKLIFFFFLDPLIRKIFY